MGRFWRGYLLPVVLFALCLSATPAKAFEIAVALSQPSGPHRQFSEALSAVPSSLRVSDAGNSQSGLNDALLQRADLIIAVGAQVAHEVLTRFQRPTMAVLVSRAQVQALAAAYPNARFSAIVLDQPPIRHVRLAGAIAPGISQIGMLFGPESLALEHGFAAAADDTGLKLLTRRIGSPGDLLPQLEQLLTASDALLIIADPMIASQSAARTILLTSYRYRRPILAYSNAYVQAGALAAVFSSPEDAARDLADWLRTLSGVVVRLPAVKSPDRFSIGVNRQVARSLGLDVPSDEALAEHVGRKVTP